MELKNEKKTEYLHIRVSKDMKEEIDKIAKENDVTVTKLMEYCFQFWKSSVSK